MSIDSLIADSRDIYNSITAPTGKFSYFECNDKLFPAASPIHSRFSSITKEEMPNISKFFLEEGNLLLVGEGGIGKTTALLRAWKELLTNINKYKLIPFYIPLNEVNATIGRKEFDTFLFSYLKNYYGVALKDNENIVVENRYSFLLLLDGFNEISTREKRIIISEEIRTIAHNKAYRIILTSRYDFIATYGLEGFQRYTILPLEKETIEEYLRSESIASESIPYTLLSNPMMLTLYANMCKVKDHLSELLTFPFYENNTKGELIANFLFCQIGKAFRIDDVEIAFWYYSTLFLICPYIAHTMENKGEFSFKQSQIRMQVQNAIRKYKDEYLYFAQRDLFSVMRFGTFDLVENDTAVTTIIRILLEDVGILQSDSLSYSFRHQYFRDFFSAWYIINDSELALAKQIVPTTLIERTLPEYITSFVGDCTREYDFDENQRENSLLSRLLSFIPRLPGRNIYLVTNNVIAIQRIAKKENLSKMLFCDLDLSQVSLNGAVLSDNDKHASFKKCIISSGTFLSQGHTGHVRSAVYNKLSDTILSAGDTTIKEWDCKTGRCIRTYYGHTNLVNSAVFHPKERRILSAANDNTVREWDRETGKCLHVFNDHTGYVTKALYDNTGDRVLSCSWDGTVLFYERVGEKWSTPIVVAKHDMNIKAICLSKDNNMFLTASGDGTVKEWGFDGKLKNVYMGHTDMVNSVTYAKDDSIIISGGYDNTIRVFQKGKREAVSTIDSFGAWVRGLAYDKKNDSIIIAVHDGSIYEYSHDRDGEYKMVSKYIGHQKSVIHVAFSTTGDRIVSTSEDGTIREWDRKSTQCIHTYYGLDLAITDTVYSDDGKSVLTIKDYEYAISKRTDGLPFFCSEIIPHLITSAVFGESENTVLYTTEEGVFIRNISDTSPKMVIDSITEKLVFSHAQFDMNYKRVIAVGKDKDACTFAVVVLEDGTHTKFPIPYNADYITFYNKDVFLTYSAGGIIRQWDIHSGNELGVMGVYLQGCHFFNCTFVDDTIESVVREAGGIVSE